MNDKTESGFLSLVQPEGKKACINLWPSFLSFEQSNKSRSTVHLGCLTSSTRQWILGTLSPSEVISKLDDESLRYLQFNAVTLPPEVRIALLEQLPLDAPEAHHLLQLCEGLDCDTLVRWLQEATQHVAAKRIWERPNDEISHLLDRLAHTHRETLEALLNGCPEQHTEVALDAMERNPGLLREEVVCSTKAGGAVLMSPLTLHVSSPMNVPGHRRVIHLEFAAQELPHPLQWNYRLPLSPTS